MINHVLLFIVPGYLSLFRHSTETRKAVFPILLVEVAPYLIICGWSGIDPVMALVSFIQLCCLYETGYAFNDVAYMIRGESKGTLRRTIEPRYLNAFIVFRISLYILMAYILKDYLNSGSPLLHLLIGIIMIFFTIHNSKIGSIFRASTFMILNILKIVFRLLFILLPIGSSTPTDINYYLSGFLPFLFIKYLHYLNHKSLISYSNLNFESIIYSTYIAWLLYLLITSNLLGFIIATLFFFNHTKKYIFLSLGYKKYI